MKEVSQVSDDELRALLQDRLDSAETERLERLLEESEDLRRRLEQLSASSRARDWWATPSEMLSCARSRISLPYSSSSLLTM